MRLSEFEIDVARTLNPDLTEEQKVDHALTMLASEVGEVLSIKQKTFQGKPFDIDKIKDELGDVLFAAVYLAHSTGISLEDIMEFNVAKRLVRFPIGFDAKRSDWRNVTVFDVNPGGAD